MTPPIRFKGPLQEASARITWPWEILDKALEAKVRESARAGSLEVLAIIDEALPALASLLSGRPVRLTIDLTLEPKDP